MWQKYIEEVIYSCSMDMSHEYFCRAHLSGFLNWCAFDMQDQTAGASHDASGVSSQSVAAQLNRNGYAPKVSIPSM